MISKWILLRMNFCDRILDGKMEKGVGDEMAFMPNPASEDSRVAESLRIIEGDSERASKRKLTWVMKTQWNYNKPIAGLIRSQEGGHSIIKHVLLPTYLPGEWEPRELISREPLCSRTDQTLLCPDYTRNTKPTLFCNFRVYTLLLRK